MIKFEWDEENHRNNISKHGVDFEDAKRIFDGFTINKIDDRQDYGEERTISIGLLSGVAVIVVVHTDRNGVCRIISARPANKKERKYYDRKIQEAFDS